MDGLFSPLVWPDSRILTPFSSTTFSRCWSKNAVSAPSLLKSYVLGDESGFQVHLSPAIESHDRAAQERLAAYLIRSSFAASRLGYDDTTGQIEYQTSKGLTRSMDALDWIDLVTCHIPDPGEHMVRYYGRYSSASRGKRLKIELQGAPRSALSDEPTEEHSQTDDPFSRDRRRSWARLLRKIYEVDPLT